MSVYPSKYLLRPPLWRSLISAALSLPVCLEAVFAQGVFEEKVILLKLTATASASLNVSNLDGNVTTGLASLDALNRQYRVVRMQRVFPPGGKHEEAHRAAGLHRYYKLHFAEAANMPAVAQSYTENEYTEHAQLNRRYHLFNESPRALTTNTLPSDPVFVDQWNLHNTGQTGGTPDADIDAMEAWDNETGKPHSIVSLLDTGIDLNHPELAGNIWINPGEISGNSIDDDGNGYLDDVHGWDFSDNDNVPDDYNDHGTHGAGIIAARINNGIGVAGIAGGWNGAAGASLMVCKIFPNAFDDVIAEAFAYAADNGARISNNAWGGAACPSPILEEAIDYYLAVSDGVVAFAAGGSNSNDPCFSYPASYPPVIAVATLDHNDQKAPSSNYGEWIDLSAPGVNIWSTVIGGYASYNGTSAACAHISGVAALLLSKQPGWNGTQLREQLESRADNIDGANPGYAGLLGSDRVNAYATLKVETPWPNPPENLQANAAGKEVQPTWADPVTNMDGSPINLDHINVGEGALIASNAAEQTELIRRFGLPPPPPSYKLAGSQFSPAPENYGLSQNYPNPFNPETLIEYQLPQSGRVSLKIYNLLGRKIRTLVDQEMSAGFYRVTWDGKDDDGRKLESGVYLYQLHTDDFAQTRKTLIVK